MQTQIIIKRNKSVHMETQGFYGLYITQKNEYNNIIHSS